MSKSFSFHLLFMASHTIIPCMHEVVWSNLQGSGNTCGRRCALASWLTYWCTQHDNFLMVTHSRNHNFSVLHSILDRYCATNFSLYQMS